MEIYNSAAPPTFLGENVPFLFLARGIVQVVINARKGKNEVKIFMKRNIFSYSATYGPYTIIKSNKLFIIAGVVLAWHCALRCDLN